MSQCPRIKQVGIFGINVGNGNLGDEATFYAVIQNLKYRYPHLMLYGFSSNPYDTQKRYTIPVFPIHRFAKKAVASENKVFHDHKESNSKTISLQQRIKSRIKAYLLIYNLLKTTYKILSRFWGLFEELLFLIKSFNNLKRIDLLIIAGGGLLSDHFGGTSNFPYTIFKWSVIARMSSTKLVFLSVGAGPLKSVLSRLLIKQSLSLANYRSFRDGESKNLIEKMNLNGDNPIFPDLAYSLRINGIPYVSYHKESRPIVGINPFPHFYHRYWPIADHTAYEGYVKKLAMFTSWLLANNYRILFFPTQIWADPLIIRDIRGVMERTCNSDWDQNIIERPVSTIEDLISQISAMELVVATRFHGILLSFLMSKPVLGISNHPKTDSLMIDMGQSDYLMNIDSFDVPSLTDKFMSLKTNRASVIQRVNHAISEYRGALELQYDRLFSLLESSGSKS